MDDERTEVMAEEAQGMPDPAEENRPATQTPTVPANTEFARENAVVRPRRPRTNKTTVPAKKLAQRSPEECYMLDPKKMTDAEKVAVIKFYQENVQGVYDQFESYKKNTEGAFEQARKLREENMRLRQEMKAKLGLIKQNINLLHQNTLLIDLED